jgi:succinate-semialdehyde dehydrogenase/glutarate-semialdehyde dehydrogenase
VVTPSADLDRATTVAVQARVQNNGQSCIAAKRFIVHRDVYDAFEERFVAKMRELTVGDPMDPSTELGPLAQRQGRDEVRSQVEDARTKGATVLSGDAALPERGWFYPPTVITGVKAGMRVHSEEVFGPVAMLYRVDSTDEAVELANATTFGLGASVWGSDEREQLVFIERIEAGMVFVNSMVVSTPELPFGGTKRSGYGRELSALGIREFCEAKSVFVA